MIAKLSMERIRELDKVWATEVSKFLQLGTAYGEPHPLFLQEKQDSAELNKLAQKWKVPLEEFHAYYAVCRYIQMSAEGDCENLPSPEDIALVLGVSDDEFEDYFHQQVKVIHDAWQEDEDDFQEPKDSSFGEWELEDDLLQEAGRRGMC